jgi:acetylornithine deacetylase/succinyl-diaminopimelate desuccinylase-like protein
MTRTFPTDDGALVALARDLAGTPSVSGSERAAVELVSAAMRDVGLRTAVDAAGNVVGVIGRGVPGAPRLLIDGHIDSIPQHSADRWSVDPFGGLIDDDGRLVAGAGQALAAVGLDPTPMTYSFRANGSSTAGELGIPTVGFGVGEEQVAHRADEYVTLASLRAGARGLASRAPELAGR